jgi:hypothetical protein
MRKKLIIPLISAQLYSKLLISVLNEICELTGMRGPLHVQSVLFMQILYTKSTKQEGI